MKETDPAATEASQGYPDKAILNVTLDELKAAPDFKYASSTLADSDMQPAGCRPGHEENHSIIGLLERSINARRSGRFKRRRSVEALV